MRGDNSSIISNREINIKVPIHFSSLKEILYSSTRLKIDFQKQKS